MERGLGIARYGLACCLERDERNGAIYHRDGITRDYNNFDDVETLIEFVRTGEQHERIAWI